MRNGHELDRLSERLRALLDGAETDKARRQTATRKAMEEIERRLRHVAVLVAGWNLRQVIPRLEEVRRHFPNARPLSRKGARDCVCLCLDPCPEHPVQAQIYVESVPDPAAETVRVSFRVVILPTQADYDREGWIDLLVHAPDTAKLGEFLDQRIERFVGDYLRMREPDSPYQAENLVTDPVCKMRFTVAEAASQTTFQDRIYFFCVESCKERFERTPERYVAS